MDHPDAVQSSKRPFSEVEAASTSPQPQHNGQDLQPRPASTGRPQPLRNDPAAAARRLVELGAKVPLPLPEHGVNARMLQRRSAAILRYLRQSKYKGQASQPPAARPQPQLNRQALQSWPVSIGHPQPQHSGQALQSRPVSIGQPQPQHSGQDLQPRPVSIGQPQPQHSGQALQSRPVSIGQPQAQHSGQALQPRPVTPWVEMKDNEAASAEQELAELLGDTRMSAHFASAFDFDLSLFEDNGGGHEYDGPERQPWSPRPPPELHEGLEVVWESGQQRCVAASTSHVSDCLRPVRRSRSKQRPRAAKCWRGDGVAPPQHSGRALQPRPASYGWPHLQHDGQVLQPRPASYGWPHPQHDGQVLQPRPASYGWPQQQHDGQVLWPRATSISPPQPQHNGQTLQPQPAPITWPQHNGQTLQPQPAPITWPQHNGQTLQPQPAPITWPQHNGQTLQPQPAPITWPQHNGQTLQPQPAPITWPQHNGQTLQPQPAPITWPQPQHNGQALQPRPASPGRPQPRLVEVGGTPATVHGTAASHLDVATLEDGGGAGGDSSLYLTYGNGWLSRKRPPADQEVNYTE
ncbi:uncharacterized protein LOC126980786 [Eriocheir sinensis]|uniref:uncharacterized protein LOC126980786 n=1 Tax=Eriocheir sinensis TaxID=95602 RepID=UPI0021C7C422|nr:uncharacterized protein LOC126980786 [Eriocheir sinensis]